MLKPLILLVTALLFIAPCPGEAIKNGDNWWQHTIVYQVYPRSFQDSDGDGTGDLKGIESRLGYFVELGVETIWLSPIFKSPMKDFGYDISDFIDIDPTFGTLEDFKSLITAAHDLGLKIVLDFVPNHSSDEHSWFIKSVAKEEPYTDYYTWLDPSGFDASGKPIPPNNWVAVFGGPAWTFNDDRGQFYLHQFLPGQPDLNYRNPSVLEEMKNVIKFWLDLGVDGFRMDAVFHIWEDSSFPNEPLSGFTNDSNSYGYLNHIYTTNLPQTRDVLKAFQELIKSYTLIDGHDRVNMLEIYLSPNDVKPYYEVCDYPFNFGFIGFDEFVNDYVVMNQVENWMTNLPDGKVPNWVLGNHDNWRVGSKTRPELINALNMLTLTLPGVSVTYYGEEIGMLNTNVSWEDTVDPSGCNCGIDHFNDKGCSRDPERTPMQWSHAEPSAGFSSTNQTWLPVNSNFVALNVEDERKHPFSHLEIYKKIVELRYAYPEYATGGLQVARLNNIFAFTRGKSMLTLINFNSQGNFADFSFIFDSQRGKVFLSTLGENTTNIIGADFYLDNYTLGPYEGLIVRLV